MPSPLDAYYAKCLQANWPGALRALRGAVRGSGSGRTRAFLRKVEARFLEGRSSVTCRDPFARALILAYRDYYRQALRDLRRENELEEKLRVQLLALASAHGLPATRAKTWRTLEELLERELRRRGFHALTGRITPLRSLLIWRREKTRTFPVTLVGGRQTVKVKLLSDFVELGWMHFCTFGRYYVGGWAKKDLLYCVTERYGHDLQGEAFRVSYLTHEAQHQWDLRRFSDLTQGELEYRAKLAELVAAKRTRARLLRKFAAEARKDPSLPHSHAAYRVRQLLEGVRPRQIPDLCRRELLRP